MIKRSGLLLILTLLIAIPRTANRLPPASAQDGPFSVAWDDLEVITLENFRHLTKIYSVNLGEGSTSIGDSFYADGQLSIAASLHGQTVTLIEATESQIAITPLQSFDEPSVSAIDFSNDGEQLSISTYDGVYLWNTQTHEVLATINQAKLEDLGLHGPIYDAAFHPITDHLVTTNYDTLVEWDARLEVPIKTWLFPGLVAIAIDYAPRGDVVAIGNWGGVFLANWETREEMSESVSSRTSQSLMFNTDGSVLGYITDGGFEVGLWYMTTSTRMIIIYSGYGQIGNDIGFNADGRLFMIATPHSLEFYNAATGGNRGRLTQYEGEMVSLTTSSDGRFLITGHANGDLNIWGVPSNR